MQVQCSFDVNLMFILFYGFAKTALYVSPKLGDIFYDLVLLCLIDDYAKDGELYVVLTIILCGTNFLFVGLRSWNLQGIFK